MAWHHAVRTAFTDEDRAFIEACSMFFVATVDVIGLVSGYAAQRVLKLDFRQTSEGTLQDAGGLGTMRITEQVDANLARR